MLVQTAGHPAPSDPLNFTLPPELEASAPPEARGLRRDDVRLMVSHRTMAHPRSQHIIHTQFSAIGCHLRPGDVLVINTSGTLRAALPAQRADGTPLVLHLSTRLPADLWSVELRQPVAVATRPFPHATSGETLTLPADGRVTLHTPHATNQRGSSGSVRLWIATLDLPCPLADFLSDHGRPIRYSYVPEQWPIDAYQTVYATEPGSAEMPSAGRAFTPELLTDLVVRGVQLAPLILHTGVASLEDHEPPYEEFYRVPATTADLVNQARANGQRVIAVGTTAVRALETGVDGSGRVHPGSGWTNLVITPQRGLRAVDGILTGLHEPRATHLALLEALCGREHLRHTYTAALEQRYLWHEFGDLHLILP